MDDDCNFYFRVGVPCEVWVSARWLVVMDKGEGKLKMERATGVEPVSQPWEGWALPLYQARAY